MPSHRKRVRNTDVITKIRNVEDHPNYKEFYVLWADGKKWSWEKEENVKKKAPRLYNSFMRKWNSDYVFKSKVTLYHVRSILSEKIENGKRYYEVKWDGYDEISWEPEECLKDSSEAVEQFKRKKREEEGKHRDSLARVTVLEDLSRIKSAEFCLPWRKLKNEEQRLEDYSHVTNDSGFYESSLPDSSFYSTAGDTSVINMKGNSTEDLPLHICEDAYVNFSGKREAPIDLPINNRPPTEDLSHHEFDAEWEELDLRLAVERDVNNELLKEGGLFEGVYGIGEKVREDSVKYQKGAETLVTFEYDDNESLDLTLPTD